MSTQPKYLGFYSWNGGNSYNAIPVEGNNIKAMRAKLRRILKGNLQGPQDIGKWSIRYADDKGGMLTPVCAMGTVRV